MILSIASGKGGTGKTSVAVNMAISLGHVQLLDCDVEEPNAHILLQPRISATKPVYLSTPLVDEEKCSHCGKCGEFCEFNALFVTAEKVLFFPELCHGCGGCAIVCPKDAIREKNVEIGVINIGMANEVELVYGELNVGEPMAVPIIRELKKQIKKGKTVIIDSPPGTSCPVIESVYGSDYCILVSEPTPFGLHDLKITVEVLEKIDIPFGVVINRAGIGDGKIYDYCEEKGARILCEIPFQREIAELYSRGIPFVLKKPEWKNNFKSLMNDVKESIRS